MLNEEATKLSRETIPEQMAYLKQSFPFLRKLHLTDASEDGKYAVDVKMDYFCGIDAYGKDLAGGNYDFQLKARKPGHNDLIFPVRKIKDADIRRNPNIGFNWHEEKYTFLTEGIDIYVEKVGGKNYTIRATDLMAMEKPYDGEDSVFNRKLGLLRKCLSERARTVKQRPCPADRQSGHCWKVCWLPRWPGSHAKKIKKLVTESGRSPRPTVS